MIQSLKFSLRQYWVKGQKLSRQHNKNKALLFIQLYLWWVLELVWQVIFPTSMESNTLELAHTTRQYRTLFRWPACVWGWADILSELDLCWASYTLPYMVIPRFLRSGFSSNSFSIFVLSSDVNRSDHAPFVKSSWRNSCEQVGRSLGSSLKVHCACVWGGGGVGWRLIYQPSSGIYDPSWCVPPRSFLDPMWSTPIHWPPV